MKFDFVDTRKEKNWYTVEGGENAREVAGEFANIKVGNYSCAIAGYSSTCVSGDHGKSQTGARGTSISDNNSLSISGDYGVCSVKSNSIIIGAKVVAPFGEEKLSPSSFLTAFAEDKSFVFTGAFATVQIGENSVVHVGQDSVVHAGKNTKVRAGVGSTIQFYFTGVDFKVLKITKDNYRDAHYLNNYLEIVIVDEEDKIHSLTLETILDDHFIL